MRFCFLFVLVLVGSELLAQEASVTATNPASLKWFQINTPHFRVLYPQGFDVPAQRMANTLEAIREPEAKTMLSRIREKNGRDSSYGITKLPRKISIVLQSQSAISNAFVSITPRRAEFYAMPSQNYNFLGTNDWLNLLASHEYRHVVQFKHALRGLNKAAYYIGGSNTFSLGAYVSAPQWFWEGDAVSTETAFTHSGRGRIPNFDLILRTNLQEGRVFNYHKQYLRSYKNNINDHYVLGYHMVSYLRKRTGDPYIWDKVTKLAWSYPFPLNFSTFLKSQTGLTVTQLYREMAADLQKEWKAQYDSLHITNFERVNQRKSKAYTDYMYPQELEDGTVIARKSGIGDIETLVAFKNGEEQKVFVEGIINETGMQSAAGGRVVWNEYRFDPRWQVRTYSSVVGLDLRNGQRQVINTKGRYAGAALSPDGKLVATVETTTSYETKLVVLDYLSGAVVKTLDNADNNFISMPRWTNDGQGIVALVTKQSGRAIVQFNINDGSSQVLSDYSEENIGHPVRSGDFVFYNSPGSGIDNIYALDVKTGARFQVTCSKYGAYNPAISRDGKWIYYNEQGRDGMDIVKVPFEASAWKKWSTHFVQTPSSEVLAQQEGRPELFNHIPTQKYPVKPFRRWKGILNPYSWGATVGTTYTDTQIPIGITSQDVLSTTQLFAGFVYDRSEKTWTQKASVSFQGWYPIINVSASHGNRNVNEGNITIDSLKGTNPNYTGKSYNETRRYKWTESNVEAGLSLPLITTSSKYYGSVTIGNAVGITKVTNFVNTIGTGSRVVPTLYINDTAFTNISRPIFVNGKEVAANGYYHPIYFETDYSGNGNLLYNHFSFSAYRLLKQSRRDINSKWGQALYIDGFGTPYGGDYIGNQFSILGVGYFPGLFKHHSFWGYWGYQHTQMSFLSRDASGKGVADNQIYFFRNKLPVPRGNLGISRFEQFFSMSANYTMPVWYPDIAIGPLLNIQRMRVNGFFDYGYGNDVYAAYSQEFASTGVEVKFDINVMRLLPQLDIGFRVTQGLTPSTTFFEFLLGTFNF